jgi:sulfate transport system permease protein
MLVFMMLPLVFLPLASIFIFGTSKGLASFWAALMAPEAVFALKLSMATSFWATLFNVVFGLFASYVLSRYNFWGRNALIVTISLPTAIPTAVAGFALLLLWGPYGTLGRFLSPDRQLMFTAGAIILANIFVTFPLAFGVINPVFDTMSRSLEEASATIGATRWQTFWHVTLPSVKWALLYGVILCNARAMGEFGAVSVVSGHITGQTDTMPLRVEKLHQGASATSITAAFAVASLLALLALITLVIKSYLEWKTEREQSLGQRSMTSSSTEHIA